MTFNGLNEPQNNHFSAQNDSIPSQNNSMQAQNNQGTQTNQPIPPQTYPQVSQFNAVPPQNNGQGSATINKKPFYKKWWVWIAVGVIAIGAIGGTTSGAGNDTKVIAEASQTAQSEDDKKIESSTIVPKTEEDAPRAEVHENNSTDSKDQDGKSQNEEASIPIEYSSALRKAQSYSKTMHMSKTGIYNQLTSEYGEQFSAEAAQYDIDNLNADYNANALEKARSYSETMHLSQEGIYDQLVSEYGEQFTPEEARYAADNLNADYNANALAKAKSYQDSMAMSPAAIYDQLISEYGEKFTAEQAQYAIDHLNN